MKRWTVRILCWLALGAVVNVAVAWAADLTRKPMITNTVFVESSEWPVAEYAKNTFWTSTGGNMVAHGFGWTEAIGFADHMQMRLAQVGWPCRSLRHVYLENPFIERSGWVESFAVPAPGVFGLPSHTRLPVRPIWLGFALNTLFYTLPIALWRLAPASLRRGHRRRRNLCIHCAYPVGDEAKPCPECGKGVRA